MRRYKQGEPISSLDELMKEKFIWVQGKVYHQGWFSSWALRNTMNLIRARKIFKVIDISIKEDA